MSIHVDRDKPFLVTSNFLGESQCFLPTEIIAEIVGLYCGFAYDEQTEWLRVTLGSSGAKKEARRKDIAAAGIEKKTYRPTWPFSFLRENRAVAPHTLHVRNQQ